jgi:hypothetical protein
MSDCPTTELHNLKPGDAVIYHPGGTYSTREVWKIERLTETQIVIGRYRFNRIDGYMRGNRDSWRWAKISAPQPGEVQQVLDEVEKRRLVSKLHDFKWAELTLEQLRAVQQIVSHPNHGGGK